MLRQQEEEIEQLQRQLTERQREQRQQLASAAPNSVSSPASRDAAERTSATDDAARNRYESVYQPAIQHTHTRGAHACTHAHTFNGPFPGTTRVSRYQKGKTDLDFAEARDSEWQWHQLGHMQVCTSLQTNNHASTPPLSFYRPDALPAAQPTASKH